mgnify:CR=1 FL=1
MSKCDLSIIVPVFNEEKYIIKCLLKLYKIKKKYTEIIVVNDGSDDQTNYLLKKNDHLHDIYISYTKNKGKGFAVREGLKKARGDITIIHDGDLEYDPKDIFKIFEYMKVNKLDAVYGSRLINFKKNNFISKKQIFSNIGLTKFSNFLNNQKLTDAHTCYKALRTNIFKKLNLTSKGFELCVEINTKLSLNKILIKELPINFAGRSIDQGKKIRFLDGIKAIYTILKIKLK